MSGLNISQIKQFIVAPVCERLAAANPKLNSAASVPLILGIANKEGLGLSCIRQLGGGPARGLCQMEPATRLDLMGRQLAGASNASMLAALMSFVPAGADLDDEMQSNLHFMFAACRLRMWFVPEELPAANDARGLCQYWKTYWNTPAGAGIVDATTIAYFQEAISA
jgi:hypothetical protein